MLAMIVIENSLNYMPEAEKVPHFLLARTMRDVFYLGLWSVTCAWIQCRSRVDQRGQ